MKIGVIVAMTEEIGRLSNHGEIKTKAGVPYTKVSFCGNETILALCGIGPANAASCTQLLISEFGCEAILNIGLSGNACSLPIGGAVVVDKAVYHDISMDFVAESAPFTTSFAPCASFIELADKVLTKLGVTHVTGTVATGSIFVQDKEIKKQIVEKTGCSCIEMEGAAIAHTAMKNDIPFCLVKVISDSAEDGAIDQFHESLNIADYINESTSFIKEFCSAL